MGLDNKQYWAALIGRYENMSDEEFQKSIGEADKADNGFVEGVVVMKERKLVSVEFMFCYEEKSVLAFKPEDFSKLYVRGLNKNLDIENGKVYEYYGCTSFHAEILPEANTMDKWVKAPQNPMLPFDRLVDYGEASGHFLNGMSKKAKKNMEACVADIEKVIFVWKDEDGTEEAEVVHMLWSYDDISENNNNEYQGVKVMENGGREIEVSEHVKKYRRMFWSYDDISE